MQDELTWKLSLLVDDELPPDEAIILLERINQDPELRFKWYQYHTIRQALRNSESTFPQQDFLERIQIALETESIPQDEQVEQSSRKPDKFHFNLWFVIPMALAAAVVVVVLLQDQQALPLNPIDTTPMMVAGNIQKTTLEVASTREKPTPVPLLESPPPSDTSLMDDFLLVHSEDSLYQAGPQHMLSYARIISYGNH